MNVHESNPINQRTLSKPINYYYNFDERRKDLLDPKVKSSFIENRWLYLKYIKGLTTLFWPLVPRA